MAARVNSIMILGQRRERHGGGAFLLQRSRFLEARLAIDAPRLGLPVMHLAGLLGEGRADMLGIGLKMSAEILEEGIGLLAPDRLKRFGGGRPAISTSNSRPALSAGMRARASAEAARSISAKMTPGSSPASARISPQGETIRLCPKVARPFSCSPPWVAA